MASPITIAWWVVFPYACLSIGVVGHLWRFRADAFRWSNRTVKADEKRSLGFGSALFHYGIVASLAGHAVGLLIPAEFLARFFGGPTFHPAAAMSGLGAGLPAAVGFALIMQRRLTNAHLRKRTNGLNGGSYALLAATIASGLCGTVAMLTAGADYHPAAGVWLRGLLSGNPQPDLMADAPLVLRAHAIAGLLLAALWPFTRLVHSWSAPLQALWKPTVYRSRFADPPRRPSAVRDLSS